MHFFVFAIDGRRLHCLRAEKYTKLVGLNLFTNPANVFSIVEMWALEHGAGKFDPASIVARQGNASIRHQRYSGSCLRLSFPRAAVCCLLFLASSLGVSLLRIRCANSVLCCTSSTVAGLLRTAPVLFPHPGTSRDARAPEPGSNTD